MIERGKEWGELGHPDLSLPRASNDGEASDLVSLGMNEFVLLSGDMARTMGAVAPAPDSRYRRLSVDGIEIVLERRNGKVETVTAFSHVIIHRPWFRGGIFFGDVSVLCNAQYVRNRDLAPRSHPNDGKFEMLGFSSHLTLRQRLQILERSKNGSHLPHPSIRFIQTSRLVDLDAHGRVEVDGRKLGTGRVVSAYCRADSFTVWIALPSVSSKTLDEPAAGSEIASDR